VVAGLEAWLSASPASTDPEAPLKCPTLSEVAAVPEAVAEAVKPIAAVASGPGPPGDNTRARRSNGLDQATWEPSYRRR